MTMILYLLRGVGSTYRGSWTMLLLPDLLELHSNQLFQVHKSTPRPSTRPNEKWLWWMRPSRRRPLYQWRRWPSKSTPHSPRNTSKLYQRWRIKSQTPICTRSPSTWKARRCQRVRLPLSKRFSSHQWGNLPKFLAECHPRPSAKPRLLDSLHQCLIEHHRSRGQ